jgi:hypothetical protein
MASTPSLAGGTGVTQAARIRQDSWRSFARALLAYVVVLLAAHRPHAPSTMWCRREQDAYGVPGKLEYLVDAGGGMAIADVLQPARIFTCAHLRDVRLRARHLLVHSACATPTIRARLAARDCLLAARPCRPVHGACGRASRRFDSGDRVPFAQRAVKHRGIIPDRDRRGRTRGPVLRVRSEARCRCRSK